VTGVKAFSTSSLEPFLQRSRIAYFSMEIALRPEIHTYSGGLGVLAGDTARSCADFSLPIVFVTLLSRAGYVHQDLDKQGRQLTQPNPWQPEDWTQPVNVMIAVRAEGRDVWIRPWIYLLNCPLGHCVPVLLLDTDLEQNSPQDRHITDHLYGGDEANRLKQEIVLGIGGARILQALGFQISKYHLNEGHAALLTVYLLRQFRRSKGVKASLYDDEQVRERCIFTTHTPVEAAFDKFSYALVSRVLGDYIELDELKRHAGDDHLNMTRLALNLSGYVNGVSERHAQTASGMFPGYDVRAVTNGVHAPTWTHVSFARLFHESFPQWAHDPEVLRRAERLSDDVVWNAHQDAKRDLTALVKARCDTSLSADVPILGFARRMWNTNDRLCSSATWSGFRLSCAGARFSWCSPGWPTRVTSRVLL